MYYLVKGTDGGDDDYVIHLSLDKNNADAIANALNRKAEADFDLSQLTLSLGYGCQEHFYVIGVDAQPLIMYLDYKEGVYTIGVGNTVCATFLDLKEAYDWALAHRIILKEKEYICSYC